MSKFITGIATLLMIAGTAVSSGRASVFLPFGPQNDIPLSTVTGTWGWTQIYRGDYGAFDVPVSTAFAGAGQYVMIGAIRDGSSTLEVLAAALTSVVQTYTPQNVTTPSNGSEWYYNAYSLGFAGLGDTIQQFSADVNGQNERDRLSWHTGIGGPGFNQTPLVPPVDIDGGWRAGTFTGLNSDTTWDRVIFTANLDGTGTVPEWSSFVTWALIGLVLPVRLLVRRSRVQQLFV